MMLISINIKAQDSISLNELYKLATLHQPNQNQYALITSNQNLLIKNSKTVFLPQVSINGQATYQSAVTSLPIKIPNIAISELSKDQYKISLDANQLIYDGKQTKSSIDIVNKNAELEAQKIKVEEHKTKENILALYLQWIQLNNQQNQIEILRKDISLSIKKIQNQIESGLSTKTALYFAEIENIKSDQRILEIKNAKKSIIEIINLFTGQNYPSTMILSKVIIPTQPISSQINRPELKLSDIQEQLVNIQMNAVSNKLKPRVSLFSQVGYGRPGFNFLDNSFAPFALAGLRTQWNLAYLYNIKHDKSLLQIQKQTIDIQRQNFILGIDSKKIQYQNEINSQNQLIEKDKEIILLRNKIKEIAAIQFEQGIITSTDYIKELNALEQANQNLITHQIQLLSNYLNYELTTNNFPEK